MIKAYFSFSLWEFIQLDFILRVLASNVLNAKFLAFSTSRQTPKTHLHLMSQMSNYFSTCYSTLLLVEGHCSMCYYYFIHLISLSLSLSLTITIVSFDATTVKDATIENPISSLHHNNLYLGDLFHSLTFLMNQQILKLWFWVGNYATKKSNGGDFGLDIGCGGLRWSVDLCGGGLQFWWCFLGCSGGDFGMGLVGDLHHSCVGWLVKTRWLWQ